MIKWLKGLFSNISAPVCGGTGCVSVVDGLGRERARLYFRRPTSDEILTFVYEQQNALGGSEDKLREIQNAKSQIRKMHEMIVHDIYLPWAEKVFIKSEGYVDDKGKLLDDLEPLQQFELLKKYHSHNLVDMVSVAFEREGTIKKKD